MTDRELLEAAAKANGMVTMPENYHPDAGVYVIDPMVGRLYWNPLEDDGDALRLAVRLFLFVIVEGDQEDDARRRTQAGHRSIGSKSQPHGGDPAAATRRAITRAAAAMKAPA